VLIRWQLLGNFFGLAQPDLVHHSEGYIGFELGAHIRIFGGLGEG
jgi:hypothetical protein